MLPELKFSFVIDITYFAREFGVLGFTDSHSDKRICYQIVNKLV